MNTLNLRRRAIHLVTALALSSGLLCNSASAQSTASEMSGISVVASVVAPVLFITASGQFVVKGVQASADGVVYLLEKIGTGVQGSVTLASNASGAVSVGVGSVITVSATAAGMLLVSAGKVLAIVPNELGKTLLKNRRIS